MLTAQSLVWSKLMSDWKPVQATELAAFIHRPNAPPPLPPPVSTRTVDPIHQRADNFRPAESAPPDDHRNLIVWGWIGAFLIPLVGIILAIILLTKGKVGHGIGQIGVSFFMMFFWVGFWPAFWAAANR